MGEFDRVAIVWTGSKEEVVQPGHIPEGIITSKNLPAVLGCTSMYWQDDRVPDLTPYDLFVVMDFGLGTRHVSAIKKRRPDAVVIASVDPPPEHVFDPSHWGPRYKVLLDELAAADYIGSRMYSQQDAEVYAGLLGWGRDRIVTIPIPIGSDAWFANARATMPKEDFILTLDHNWTPKISAPNLAALKAMQAWYPWPIKYVNAAPHTQDLARHMGLNVEFLPQMSAGEFTRLTLRARLAVDIYAMHSVGRFGILCAYCGTACVGSNTTDHGTQNPYAFDPLSVGGFGSLEEFAEDDLWHVRQLYSFDAVRKHFRDDLLTLPVLAFQHFAGVHDVAALNTPEALSHFWGDAWVREHYYETPARIQLFEAALASFDKPMQFVFDHATRILDVGCGPGEFLKLLYNLRPQVELFGVDYAESAIDQTIAKVPGVQVYSDDFLLQGNWQNRFDLAFAFEVLEHQDDPVAFVNHMLYCTVPGDYVILTVPDGAHDSWKGHKQRWTLAQFNTFLSHWGGEAHALPGLPNLLGIIRKA